ncbi:hypothetical protein MTBLM1_60176 [Rhodospirillaceae bacterium LM-1]|nr:hypothetical protein MTBLM1_60176 [Rhodospirillaceae bacterium LM-1]
MSDAIVRSKSLLDNTLMEVLVFLLFISYVAYSDDDKSVRAIPVTGPLPPSCLVRNATTYDAAPLVEIEARETGLVVKKINNPSAGGNYQAHPIFKNIPTTINLKNGETMSPKMAQDLAELSKATELNVSPPTLPTKCVFYSEISGEERFLLQHIEDLRKIDAALPILKQELKDNRVILAMIAAIKASTNGPQSCLERKDKAGRIMWVGTATLDEKIESKWKFKEDKIDLKNWRVNPALMAGSKTLSDETIKLADLPNRLAQEQLPECVLYVGFEPKAEVIKKNPGMAADALTALENIRKTAAGGNGAPKFEPSWDSQLVVITQAVKAQNPSSKQTTKKKDAKDKKSGNG